MLVTVKIEDYELLEMLMERVKVWSDDPDVQRLYELYYNGLIEAGCFDGMELDINSIVDNDYINYLSIYDEDELKQNDLTPDDERVYSEYNGLYLVNMC